MVIVDNITVDAILGLDFLEANNCTIITGERLLQIPSCKSFIPVSDHLHCSRATPVYAILTDTMVVPAYSEVEQWSHAPYQRHL